MFAIRKFNFCSVKNLDPENDSIYGHECTYDFKYEATPKYGPNISHFTNVFISLIQQCHHFRSCLQLWSTTITLLLYIILS